MLIDVALRFMNHLLASEDWAQDRLRPFAGQTAHLALGALNFPLEITADGGFRPANKNTAPSVTITLPADAPMRAITDRASLFATAHVSGSAELAETLGFVFRNLRWDVESDLSQLIGDIAARRLVQGSKQLLTWQLEQANNLAQNLAEYFTEENPTIAHVQDISTYCEEIGELQTHLNRLERRIASLENIYSR